MREERVSHVHGAMPALEEPMMRARAVVEREQLAANLDEIAASSGARATERACRCRAA